MYQAVRVDVLRVVGLSVRDWTLWTRLIVLLNRFSSRLLHLVDEVNRSAKPI